MYNDLLGDKKRKLKGRWSLEIAQDLKARKYKPIKVTPQSEIKKLSFFLLRNFHDHIEEVSAVDNAIILLQKALDYELEVCGGCSHKEKLKYLADHDMIKDV